MASEEDLERKINLLEVGLPVADPQKYTTRLIEELEGPHEFSWALQEYTPDGQPIGDKYIPLPWTMYFRAQPENELFRTIWFDRSVKDQKERENCADESKITLRLQPNDDYKQVYSCFGTDQELSIYLSIRARLRDRERPPSTDGSWLQVLGDRIYIDCRMTPSRFDSIATTIKRNGIASMSVSIGGVSGFYVRWSPMHFARTIKVLKDSGDVVMPSGGTSVTPPRVGRIGSLEIEICERIDAKSKTLVSEAAKMGDEGEQDERNEAHPSHQHALQGGDFSPTILKQFVESAEQLAALKRLLWVVVVLLGLLLLKGR